jgi:hypothetical protein
MSVFKNIFQRIIPRIIKTADSAKISGQNRKGKNFALKSAIPQKIVSKIAVERRVCVSI